MSKLTSEEHVIARKVANKERCLHGLIFEYCAQCQAVYVNRDYKIPVDRVDPDTGEVKTIWLRGTTIDTHYRRYR